jgi:hypothetical protein
MLGKDEPTDAEIVKLLMSRAEYPERSRELLPALDVYRPARQGFLATLGLPSSNRDPLAEFSEQLVHGLLGGALAKSRVQAGHDLVLLDGRTVQVRYLANPVQTGVNEHLVYALVIFEEFAVVGVLVFPTSGLSSICAALGKRHPRQEEQLQLTRRNWWKVRDAVKRFEALDMRILLPPLIS